MSEDANDYLHNLAKWQTRSHPHLVNRTPEELFKPEFVDQYRRLHQNLWHRFIHVHGTIKTLEKLNEFPFEYLYLPDGMEFWRLVFANFLDTACLFLHGLVHDKGPKVHTVLSFRNDIKQGPWLDPKNWDLLKKTLEERRFDAVLDDIVKRVKVIRNHRIAHQLVDKQNSTPKKLVDRVSLEELRRLFDATHSIFGALSFGSAYCTLAGDMIPRTVNGKPALTCLDEVLNAVLRDSEFVNRPESNPWWKDLRKNYCSKELQVMNALRNRIDLPDA